VAYTLVVLSMGATIKRDSLYKDLNIIQDVRFFSLLEEMIPNYFLD
jgi:potassium/chloride transporter 9